MCSPQPALVGSYRCGTIRQVKVHVTSVLISIIVCAGALCFLSLLRFLSRRGQRREDEEMRRHVRRNYPDAV
jgi:hypothetical protein